MGALWVARNLTTEAEVAIKILRPQWEADAEAHAAERFRHEARVGGMLTHRNITRVFDLIEDDDGSLVLVMELLRGQTLETLCSQKHRLSCSEAVEMIVPILSALQHAHDFGVVHRDIKPSNVFLHVDPDGHTTPKLLDFGIAKMRDSSVKTRAGDALGTPSYMSPEQVRASGKIDGRSDVFSVGTLLYEIITGENPFRTDAPSATLARVLELEVDPDPRIEPRLWMEIQRALSKQPYERHGSADALAHALCMAMKIEPPRSLREPPTVAPITPESDVPAGSSKEASVRGASIRKASIPIVADESARSVPKRARRVRLIVYGVAGILTVIGVLLVAATLRIAKPAMPVVSAPLTTTAPAPSTSAAVSALPSEPPPSPAGESFEILEAPGGPKAATSNRSQSHRPPALNTAKPPASAPSVARTPGF